MTSNTLTSGNFILLTADDDLLTTGCYLKALGGTNHATTVFTIKEGGAVAIAPTTAAAAVDAIGIDGMFTTSGDFLQLKAVDAVLDGGKYLNCLGGTGSTAVFTIAENGVTTISPNLATANALTIDGATTTTTGDLIQLLVDDDNATTGFYYINCVGGASKDTTVFSVGESGAISTNSTVQSNGVITSGVTGSNGGIVVKSTGAGATTFSVTGATGNTVVGGTLDVTGAVTMPIQTTVPDATNARICTSADYGKLIVLSAADAIAITLPANGATAGTRIDFLVTVENAGTVTISPATADTLYTANSADSDAVTFASGHRIGAYARVISNGSNWIAVNLGQTTMGVTDTD